MESGRYPALAHGFYVNEPKRGEDALATYLADRIERGELRQEVPLVMACHLINLLTGSPLRWFVLGVDTEPITRQSLKKHIDSAVELFLRAYAAGAEPA